MAKCVRCGKFSLFKSFPNGLCQDCITRIKEEEREKELKEIRERQRRELEEKKRIEEEEKEKKRIEELLTLPKKLYGYMLAYDYEDVNLSVPDSKSFSEMEIGTKMFASQDNENLHDCRAVMFKLNGVPVSYFYQGKLKDMANDYLEYGGQVYCIVTSLNPDENRIQAHVGYYKGHDQDEFRYMLRRNMDAKKYKLVGNSSEEKQFNVMSSSVGQKCEIDYDIEKDKYTVINGDVIGYLPSSARKIVEEHGEENCSVFIAEVDTNDSGKYYACVYVFFDKGHFVLKNNIE